MNQQVLEYSADEWNAMDEVYRVRIRAFAEQRGYKLRFLQRHEYRRQGAPRRGTESAWKPLKSAGPGAHRSQQHKAL